jgi:glycosyltransferase involved in cell wall biosynthesis
MSRVLVAGVCPLPFENTPRSFGPGIRTWQFAWSLARAGHEVRLLAMKAPGAYDEAPRSPEVRGGVAIERLSDVAILDPATVRAAVRGFRPQAVVGASLYGSAALARAGARLPFWADQFGHVMAEAQAKAAVEGRNWPVAHAWGLLQPVLRAADRLSVVSQRQRYAAMGELGAVGRLTAETCGYEFTAVVPCALVPPEEAPPRPPGATAPLVRGVLVPEEAFVVLWSGSLNVWTDMETLAQGLETAMAREPRIHLVATGGEVPGLDAGTWRRFEARARSSPHRERFHLEGWVPAARVASYVEEADLGILADRPIYEGLLGSKNRVVQWMGAGLPVLYNRIGDLGDLLETRGLGLTFPPGDAPAFADRLLWAARHAAETRALASRARAFALAELSFEATTRELAAWAGEPRFAPDVASRSRVLGPSSHATRRQRAAALLRRLPLLRRSERMVALWRRMQSPGR